MKANVLPVLLAAERASDRGEHEDAQRLYRQVLVSDPLNPHASRELARLLADQGLFREAIDAAAAAARRHPSDARLLARLGRCLWLGGQSQAGAATLERALALDSRAPAARLWLADCRLSASRPEEAMSLVAPVLASNPRDAEARALAGRVAMATGNFREGIEHLRAALALRPGEGLHSDLAWALKRCGRLDEALVEFSAALEGSPSSPSLLAGKAEILQSLGRHDEARATVDSALERGLLCPELAIVNARQSKSKERRGAAIQVLEQTLAHVGPGPNPRADLLLALGTLREASGEFDSAFECFRASNELLPHTFSLPEHERAMQGIMDVFSAPNLARMARSSLNDPLPVFIVGMPRSGTSLVEQILACHPQVHGAGELDDLSHLVVGMPRLLGSGAGAGFPSCVLSLQTSQLDSLASRYLDRLRELGESARRVTDKMPQNFMYLGLIEVLFPGAGIVHCVRNPLDTCLSCYTTGLNPSHSYRLRLSDMAGAYRVYLRMMEHWRAVLRIPILDLSYEDLVKDPEPHVRRLVEFVGLPWDERCLRPHESRRVVATASVDQVRRPIYDSSMGRWKNYERHLGALIEGLRACL